MSADGPEQREAERLERDTYDHDVEANRADERAETFANSLFEFAKSTNDIYRTAYEAGRASAWTEMLVRATANMAKVTK